MSKIFCRILILYSLVLFFPFFSLAFDQWPDTGQTTSYTHTFGEDSDYTIKPQSYTKLGSGGVELPVSTTQANGWIMTRDNVTNLIWELKQNMDDIPDPNNPHDADNTTFSFQAVIDTLNDSNFGGYSDWRLPTIKELSTVINLNRNSPSINTTFFPNTKSSEYFPLAPYVHRWGKMISFHHGHVTMFDPATTLPIHVRAVRGGNTVSENFVDNGDGTVTDTVMGLMWRKSYNPSLMDWRSALNHCENIVFPVGDGYVAAEYDDWRLPSRNELQSLADYSRYSPAINPVFPDNEPLDFWSSTSYYAGGPPDDNAKAWCLSTEHGYIGEEYKSNSNNVRAVRSIQPGLCTIPIFITQLQSQTIASGETATLIVEASGSPPRFYQWYQGTNRDTTKPVGTNSSSYTTPALTETTSYWVRVGNACGSIDSNDAEIVVTGDVDLNRGLVAYYSFDNEADLGHDDSGNSNDGISNGATWIADGTGGIVSFDGIDDYIEVSNSEPFKTDQFSVCAFVKSNSPIPDGGGRYVFEVGWPGGGYGNGHGMYINNNYNNTNGLTAFYYTAVGSQANLLSSGDGSYQELKHYCYQFDGSKVQIYVNGVKKSEQSASLIRYSDNSNYFKIIIGRSANLGNGMHGLIDNLRIYNRALTKSEIQKLYENQPIDCTAPGIFTQPQSHTIDSGGKTTLTVSVFIEQPLNYQWYQGTSEDTSIPVGTNFFSYNTPALTETTSYWVRVSNACGNENSETATITVKELPNCSNDFMGVECFKNKGYPDHSGVCYVNGPQLGSSLRSRGTGFLIAPDLVLTCWHIFHSDGYTDTQIKENAKKYNCKFYYELKYCDNGKVNDETAIFVSKILDYGEIYEQDFPKKGIDFCLLRLAESAPASCKIYNLSPEYPIIMGASIYEIGNPESALYYKRLACGDIGFINIVGTNGNSFFQSNINNEPGTSGSPILNFFGDVIGIDVGDQYTLIYLDHRAVHLKISAIYDRIKLHLPSYNSGANVVVENVTIPSTADVNFTGTSSIIFGPNVTVESGAQVKLKAPKVNFKTDVNVEEGTDFKTVNNL